MSIRGSNFENQHPFASDHALVWERCMPDGLLYGVDMSFTSTLFTLGTGFMLVAGRMFEITAAENISISPGSGYARVYVAIDTGGAATENSFDQVSFGADYAATLDAFTELTQNEININQGAAVYQAEVAVLAINSSGVTGIERQMELVSPGAGTGAFAAIAVTYPAGSTVTVTDGKITYTAPNTSGAALFIIPYAATWTVTATDGTETASQTVEITTEGQSVSVSLSYLVPPEYQAVEFLESTGTQYINPDISGQLYTHKFVVDITVKAEGWFMGDTGATPYFGLIRPDGAGGVVVQPTANGGNNGQTLTMNTRYKLTRVYENGASNVYSDGVQIATLTQSSLLSYNPFIFCRNYNGDGKTNGLISAQLYYFAVYEADGVTLMREFIPCYRESDSVAGLWDTVSETFFTNAGTGTFIVGADI